MLDIDLIRKKTEVVKSGVASKNIDTKIVDEFLDSDKKWRELKTRTEEKQAILNKLSKERKIDDAKSVKIEIKNLEIDLKAVEDERLQKLRLIPNLPLADVLIGKSESENVVLREVGKKQEFKGFKPKDYLAIAENLNLIDIRRAAKVSGSRFGYILAEAAQLEFAIINLVIGILTNKKLLRKIIQKNNLNVSDNIFTPVIPPVLINRKAMSGMGYMDRASEEIFHLSNDDLYLVGTSEQSIGPMHMDEVFEEKNLPRRYVGFSSCFRREAGAYGKDVKGILRVHQFDKLEMLSITRPEDSLEEHKFLLVIEEYLMQELEIPYRVLQICSADLGDPAAAKFDIEAWMPGQNDGQGQYRETHSTSNTTDYQARRLNIRLRRKNGELEFVHMLNGTAFAIGRALITILENHQQKDGSIKIPKALSNFLSFKNIKPRES